MFMIFAMLGRQDPHKWLEIMPQIIHIHGKFYDAKEAAVPFEELPCLETTDIRDIYHRNGRAMHSTKMKHRRNWSLCMHACGISWRETSRQVDDLAGLSCREAERNWDDMRRTLNQI